MQFCKMQKSKHCQMDKKKNRANDLITGICAFNDSKSSGFPLCVNE